MREFNKSHKFYHLFPSVHLWLYFTYMTQVNITYHVYYYRRSEKLREAVLEIRNVRKYGSLVSAMPWELICQMSTFEPKFCERRSLPKTAEETHWFLEVESPWTNLWFGQASLSQDERLHLFLTWPHLSLIEREKVVRFPPFLLKCLQCLLWCPWNVRVS